MASTNTEHRMRSLRVAENISDLVGETPMLHLRHVTSPGAAALYAKLEYMSPGGSIKDRAAVGMIQDAELRGLLHPGSTIIEATAGNTGIGLALIGVSKGYRVILCVPKNFAEEKLKLMAALGAEVILTPDEDGMRGAIRKAKELAANTANSFVALQFTNQANPDYHYKTTAHEIYEQMEGEIDAVVLGAGTGGTFTGVARFLKEKLPAIYAVIVESQGSVLQGGEPGPHRVEGIGVSFIPETLDRSLADEIMMVHDLEAFDMVKQLAAKEGVLGGSSAGAAVYAAVQIARRLGSGKRVVTVIPDSAERYWSKNIFDGGA